MQARASLAGIVVRAVIALLMVACIIQPVALAEDGAAARPKVGLALGGGGARGAAEIGVLRVLQREGIPIDCIAGTSMGAIIGGFYAAGMTPDEIERRFYDKSLLRAFYTVPIPVRMAFIPIFFVPYLLGHSYAGFYRGKRFARFIDRSVPADRRRVEDLRIPLRVISVDLLSGRIEVIDKGSLARALQASSAIPLIRRPVSIDGKLLVDGGVLANVPVEQCRAMGADVVIAVCVDQRMDSVSPKSFRKFTAVGNRTLEIALAHFDKLQLARADVVIHPDIGRVSLLDARKKNLPWTIAAGERAAEAALAQIRELLQERSILSSP